MKQIFSVFKTVFSSKNQQIFLDLLILILPLGFLIFGLGRYGLYEPHESHFAMVGREMILRGDWITPYLNGAPYLNKPPLLYWLISLSISIFGNTEFAARLPVAIAGWIGLLFVWRWSRDLWGIEASRIAVLMMFATFGWFIFTHQILIEVVLATLIIASNYFFWKFLSNSKSWFYLFSCCFCLALGLLTKGLIAISIPIGIWTIVYVINFKKYKLSNIKIIAGFLLVIFLVLPWFVAIEKANPGFIKYFIVNEHFYRLLDKRVPLDYEVSKISILGYLGITIIWCLPWIIFLPPIIYSNWQKIKPKIFKDNLRKNQNYINAILLLVLGFLTPILVFLPISSRLIYYSLPSIPPLIILCAGFYSEKLVTKKQNFFLNIKKRQIVTNHFSYGLIFTFVGIGFCLLLILLPNFNFLVIAINRRPETISFIVAIAIILILGWLIAGVEMLRFNAQISITVLAVSLAIIYLTTIIIFFNYQNIRSSKNLVRIAEQKLWLHPDTLWIFEGSREIGTAAGITYYLNQEKDYFKKQIITEDSNQIPTGWQEGKENRVYRTVLILADSGNNRIPPQFPGEKPDYLISKQQLETYWYSDRPIVFVTDFLRNSQDSSDPFDLNLPPGLHKPLYSIGQRRIYGNQMTELLYRYNLLLQSKNK